MGKLIKVLAWIFAILGVLMFIIGFSGFETADNIFKQMAASFYMIVALMIVFGALYFNKLYQNRN